MNIFKGFLGSILTLLGCFMITTFLMRLSTGHDAFIGISDIISFFESVDVLEPFKTMYTKIREQVLGFSESLYSFGNISSFGDFFSAVGNFFKGLFYIVNIPVTILVYILKFLINLIGISIRFLDFACGFNFLQNVEGL